METEAIKWKIFEAMDDSRRLQGRLLDAVGLGRVESPYRVVHSDLGVTLRAYSDSNGPVLLIVPAPIKRPYIWDLAPKSSVVQRLVREGFRVYLISWEPPGAEGARFGLDAYADRLIADCAQAITRETGEERLIVAGHSLGGTLAAIFAALHPERVGALVLLVSPLHFGAETGRFVNLVAAQAESAPEMSNPIPGSYLSTLSYMASPETFAFARWADWFQSLADREALHKHMRVTRWTLDELELPGKLFQEVAQLLCHDDRFMRGTLRVRRRRASPDRIEAPVLAVGDARCDIVPPSAIVPCLEAMPAKEKRALWYEGDVGVALQHVGVLVGENAHKRLWPEIMRWMSRQWSERRPA
jgi:polyhydroxyalkanoate synthase